MKFFIYTLTVMAVMAAICAAQSSVTLGGGADDGQPSGPGDVITPKQVLAMIAQFRQDPVAKSGGVGMVLLQFSAGSPDLQVVMTPKVIPWMNDNPRTKYGPVLMVAFMAGDVRAQLEGHVKKDNRLAGVLQVIETYQLLKKSGAELQFPVVEQWIALQAQGKLKESLETK